jgi:hypothetical protein
LSAENGAARLARRASLEIEQFNAQLIAEQPLIASQAGVELRAVWDGKSESYIVVTGSEVRSFGLRYSAESFFERRVRAAKKKEAAA